MNSPTGWGAQCLNIPAVASTSVDAHCDLKNTATEAVTYWRFEIIFQAYAETDGPGVRVLLTSFIDATAHVEADRVFSLNYHLNASNAHYFSIQIYSGSAFTALPGILSTNAITLNTKYRVEVMYNVTAHTWGWKIDGTYQPNEHGATENGSLDTAHQPGCYCIHLGPYGDTGSSAYNAFFDRVAVDSTGWIGA